MSKTVKKQKLTERQRLFAAEYLIDLNATRAYQAAYPSCKKRETASVNASRMLRNANVAAYIQQRIQDREKRTEITQDRVLNELAEIGFSNMADYIQVQEDGTAYVNLSELTREQAAAVQEITVDEYAEGNGDDSRLVKKVKLKLIDKIRALELIGKHLAMWVERHEHTGKDGGPIQAEVTEMAPEERERRIAELLAKRDGDQK